jgi:hypothetical protein
MKVEEVVKRVTGYSSLSDQKIWEIIVSKAIAISEEWQQDIEKIKRENLAEILIEP